MNHNYPEHIMETLRQRIGLEEDDTSRDEELQMLTPQEALNECLEWEGIDGYTSWILNVIRDTFKVKLVKDFQDMSKQDFVQGLGNIFAAQDYMKKFAEEAEDLYSIKVSPAQFKKLSNTLFPITDEMSRRKEEAQYLLQCQLKEAWDMDDLGNIKGTGWGFMNAVSDMSTHRPPARKTANYQENMFIYTIDAPALLDQALKMVKEIV